MRFYGAEYHNGEGRRTIQFFKSKRAARAAVKAHNESDACKQKERDSITGQSADWQPAELTYSIDLPVNSDNLLYFLNYSEACACELGAMNISDGLERGDS